MDFSGKRKYLLRKLGMGVGEMEGWELDGTVWAGWVQEVGWRQDGGGK